MKKLGKIMNLYLLLALFIGLFACSDRLFTERKIMSSELTSNVQTREIKVKDIDITFENIYSEFAVKMMKELYEEENTCISPLSIAAAFGMVTNGANGKTKDELESLLGTDVQTFNSYFASLMSKNGKSKKLYLANSIWSRKDEVTVKDEFLDIVKNNYHAQVYSSEFDDNTVKDINNWVYNNTRGGIGNIIEKIEPYEILFLINALDFESEWKEKFEKNEIVNKTFHGLQSEKEVSMMFATEHTYIESKNAKGFIKSYADEDYKFAALLPNEDISIKEYMNSLTGEELNKILTNAQKESIRIGLPKFDFENTFDMKPTLKKLGVNEAFEEYGDFTNLGTSKNGIMYIGSVIHKTHISVDEMKTKASAVTSIGMTNDSAVMLKPIILDKPFIYMILDKNNIPIFIGAIVNF